MLELPGCAGMPDRAGKVKRGRLAALGCVICPVRSELPWFRPIFIVQFVRRDRVRDDTDNGARANSKFIID